MPNIEHIPDHVQQGVDLLISQYKDRYYITQLLKARLQGIQNIEDAGFVLLYCFLLDTAVGDQLDTLGKIVGQARGSFTDDVYRLLVKGSIARNISTGKTPDLTSLLGIIDPEAVLTETYSASIRIISGLDFLADGNWELASVYVDLVTKTKAAGISYEIQDLSGIGVSEDGIILGDVENFIPASVGYLSDIDDITGLPVVTTNSGLLTNLITP